MDTGNAERLLDNFLKGLNQTLDEFLDNRIKEWASKVDSNFVKKAPDADPNDESAEERMSILKGLTRELTLCSRRDIKLTAEYTKDWWEKFDRLDELREKANITVKHTNILSLKARLSQLVGEAEQAVNWIEEAIESNESHPWQVQDRERIRLGYLHSYMLNCAKRYDESLKAADKAARLAEAMDTKSEEQAMNANCTGGKTSIPIGIYALFAACDARVTHPDWDNLDSLRDEFTFYWNRSSILHSAPSTWNAPLQLAAVSDVRWCSRVGYRVEEILKSLYVNLGDKGFEKKMRRLQLFWIGSPVNMPAGLPPKLSAGLLLGVVVMVGIALNTVNVRELNNASVADLVEPTAEYISTVEGYNITKNDAVKYFTTELESELNTNFSSSFTDWKMQVATFNQELPSNALRFYAYDGEGSAELV